MQQVLRTKGRGGRVYTVFQLDHLGSKSSSGGVPQALVGNRVSAEPSFTFYGRFNLDLDSRIDFGKIAA